MSESLLALTRISELESFGILDDFFFFGFELFMIGFTHNVYTRHKNFQLNFYEEASMHVKEYIFCF